MGAKPVGANVKTFKETKPFDRESTLGFIDRMIEKTKLILNSIPMKEKNTLQESILKADKNVRYAAVAATYVMSDERELLKHYERVMNKNGMRGVHGNLVKEPIGAHLIEGLLELMERRKKVFERRAGKLWRKWESLLLPIAKDIFW